MCSQLFYKYKYFFMPNQGQKDIKIKYDLCLHIQPRQFLHDEIILYKGERFFELIFLFEGIVMMGIFNSEGNSFKPCLQFEKGVFGLWEIYHKEKSYATYKACQNIHALVIPHRPLLKIL